MDMSHAAWGELRDSGDIVTNADALRQRMSNDGYLFFRGLLDREQAREARTEALNSLMAKKLIHAEGPERASYTVESQPFRDLSPSTVRQGAANALSDSGQIKDLLRLLLGGDIKAFDLFFRRALGPGSDCETPHCDIVFMNQGTPNLYTAWIPLGDIPLEQGPLMVLEKSHLLERDLSAYWRWDADRNIKRIRYKHGFLFRGGHYSKNPPAVQREFGLRWLSTDFKLGDVLLFSAFTMHGTLDNRSDDVRISIDRRYQLASEPLDPRWNGEHPVGNEPPQRDMLSYVNIPYRFLLRLIQNRPGTH